MSRVIGFRLDPSNPREAEALAVLEARREAGYRTRHILTEALLRMEAADTEAAVGVQLADIAIGLDAVNQQLSRLHAAPRVRGNGGEANLSEAFVRSVKKAARPGLQLNG